MDLKAIVIIVLFITTTTIPALVNISKEARTNRATLTPYVIGFYIVCIAISPCIDYIYKQFLIPRFRTLGFQLGEFATYTCRSYVRRVSEGDWLARHWERMWEMTEWWWTGSRGNYSFGDVLRAWRLAEIGMILLLVVFVGVIVWATRDMEKDVEEKAMKEASEVDVEGAIGKGEA